MLFLLVSRGFPDLEQLPCEKKMGFGNLQKKLENLISTFGQERETPKPPLKIRTANAIFWIYPDGTA